MAAPSTRNIIPLLPSAETGFKPRVIMFIATIAILVGMLSFV